MSEWTSATQLLASSKVFRPTLIASSNTMNGRTVEKFLEAFKDVVEPKWLERHAKLIYLIGFEHYERLADKARGKDFPRGYMAYLVNANLNGLR